MNLSSLRLPAFLQHPGVQRAIKAALALGAMGYLVWIVEPSAIAEALAEAQYTYLLAAVLLLPLNVFLEGFIWRRVLTAVVPGAPWRTVYGGLMCGYTLGLVTPARAGALAGRAFYLPSGDRWAIAATVLVQRFLDMLSAIAFGTGALCWALATGLLAGRLWLGLAVAGFCITLALVLALGWPAGIAHLARRLTSSGAAHRHLAFLTRLGPLRMGDAALRAAARFLVYTTQFALLARAFSPTASFEVLYGGIGLVFFAKHLIPSLTMLDVGIREGASVFFLSEVLGLPEATAFNAAFLLFLLNLVVPAALGVPFVLRMRFERRRASPGGGEAGENAPEATTSTTERDS